MSRKPRETCQFDADKLLLRMQMNLPADVAEISPAVDIIMEAVREMECGSGHHFEIEMALREALANAILHGCQGDPQHEVQVCAACDTSRGMLIVVRDPGSGFDPNTIPSPIIGENIFSSGGRGVFLINQLMDEVYFRRGGTEIHMIKR